MLKINGVSKVYGNYVALDNVSFEVEKGEVFGLLGPNGAGKTSLIRIINQITAPDSGGILLDNMPLQSLHSEQIGYLPEERGLYKKMKVGEQAMYLSQLKGLSEKEAIKRLKNWFVKFEIQDWWDKKLEDLSKGMQQKVQFIITVLHEPKLLILDEPFSGFDPINANIIKNEILELKKKGTTIILSTHSMGSVEELCDSIALINKSKVVLTGKVNEIKKAHSRNIFDVTFTGNIIAFSNAVWGGFELIEHSKNSDDIIVARIKLSAGFTLNQFLQNIIPHVSIKGIFEVIPSMNDIFIEKVSNSNNSELITNSELTE